MLLWEDYRTEAKGRLNVSQQTHDRCSCARSARWHSAPAAASRQTPPSRRRPKRPEDGRAPGDRRELDAGRDRTPLRQPDLPARHQGRRRDHRLRRPAAGSFPFDGGQDAGQATARASSTTPRATSSRTQHVVDNATSISVTLLERRDVQRRRSSAATPPPTSP